MPSNPKTPAGAVKTDAGGRPLTDKAGRPAVTSRPRPKREQADQGGDE